MLEVTDLNKRLVKGEWGLKKTTQSGAAIAQYLKIEPIDRAEVIVLGEDIDEPLPEDIRLMARETGRNFRSATYF